MATADPQASLQVFTSSSLFVKIADFIPTVPYFVLEFKTREEVVAATAPQTWGSVNRVYWYKAIREKNLRAMKFLHALARDPASALSPQVDFSDILGYTLMHVQDDDDFLEHIYRDFGKNRQRRVTNSKLQTIVKDYPLRAIQWMHEHDLRFTAAAMNHAPVFGHLDIVQFLHENRHEECTSHAMVFASSGGHLETLRFLHENRGEECAAHAMLSAVEGGHLDCIKYLHEQKVRSVTTEAMDRAVLGGCKQECLLEASTRGHRDVVEYVCVNRLVEDPDDLVAAEART